MLLKLFTKDLNLHPTCYLMMLTSLIINKQTSYYFIYQITLYLILPTTIAYLFTIYKLDIIIITILNYFAICLIYYFKVMEKSKELPLSVTLTRLFYGLLFYTVIAWIIQQISYINKKIINHTLPCPCEFVTHREKDLSRFYVVYNFTEILTGSPNGTVGIKCHT